MSDRPVLVTGGSGLIGRNLVERLSSLGAEIERQWADGPARG